MAYREKDYLKRQLEIFAQLLARLLGFKAAGRLDDVLAEVRRGAGAVLGLEYDTLGRLDPASARALLRDPDLIEVYAQLLVIEADVATRRDDTGRADALLARAAEVRNPAPEGG